ncbi:MAG: hypothetical protein MSS82_06915 [Bacteroidales bacterium]|nr:hypothetical protein [Bacteroidales bacterium]
MKKLLSCLMGVALALSAIASPVLESNNLAVNRFGRNAFAFMPKQNNVHSMGADSPALQRAKTTAAEAALYDYAITALPQADVQGYLEAPNGEVWIYTMTYKKTTIKHDTWTETFISGYKVTVYDAALKEVGSIEDDIVLAENETKVAQVEVGKLLTKKFFNTDNSYELMVAIACNTTKYVNHSYTKVYSIGNNTPLTTIEGYYVAAVNTATDEWSEKFWITFITEEETETPEINGIMNTVDYVFKTYKYAGYSGLDLEHPALAVRVPAMTIAGENAIPFSSVAYNGKPYFAVNRMKYCWYQDPFDQTNDNPTPDNELICELYTTADSWATTAKLYSTTIVSSDATIDDCYYLYHGTFSWEDISFGRYTSDGTPSLIITREHFVPSQDDYSYDYFVVKAAPQGTTAEGEKIVDLAQNVAFAYFMNDIPGQAPQVMFIKEETSASYLFSFVNLLTGKEEFFLPSNLGNNISLTTSTDRIATADGYLLYCPQVRGESDKDGNVYTSVAYVRTDGTIDHIDRLNMGKDIDLAQIYPYVDAYNPYLLNLDDAREYLVLVRRRDVSGEVGNHEELLIISSNPEKDYLLQLTPDETWGTLANIALLNTDNDNPKLCVIYINDEYMMTSVLYSLPFVLYEQGDGSAANPYVITSVGGLEQIKADPTAHYIIGCDFDAGGYEINRTKTFNFTGTLDGQNHIVANLKLAGRPLLPFVNSTGGTSVEATTGIVRNINFINPVYNATGSNQGMLIGNATGATLSNIHVYGGKVSSAESIAGLVGKASLYTAVSECSFDGEVVCTTDEGAAGIAGTIHTSSTINACAVSGTIKGGSLVGGIVSSIMNNAGIISDCHVAANITGAYTIGGIAGESRRPLIQNCHVEGALCATSSSRWGGGPMLGGIVGDLYPEVTPEDGSEIVDHAAVIKGCYVNLASLTFTGELAEEAWAGQNNTMHRIVGRSSINNEPEIIGYDADDNPVYGNPVAVEPGLVDNYAVVTLAKVDADIEDAATTTEGKSLAVADTDKAFFEGLGWKYGTEVAQPWAVLSDEAHPALWFEGGIIVTQPVETTVNEGDEFAIEVFLAGDQITEEMFGGMTLAVADETIIALTDKSFTDGVVLLTFNALKVGNTTVAIGLNGKTATIAVTVLPKGTAVDNVVAEGTHITIADRIATAQDCTIRVYSLLGARLMEGYSIVDLNRLSAGVYIITATTANGATSSLKVALR